MSAQLDELLEAAGVPGPYVLAGHSFGGLTMLIFAEAHPEKVAGVVLIDSSHPRQDEAFAAVPALVAAQKAARANREANAVRAEVAGRPVYLAIAAHDDDVVRLKPQNLLTNLPLAAQS